MTTLFAGIDNPILKNGDAGYRSLYLSHAERALYHLSYTPVMDHDQLSPRGVLCAIVPKWSRGWT
jgi:hypothetical protein